MFLTASYIHLKYLLNSTHPIEGTTALRQKKGILERLPDFFLPLPVVSTWF